MYVFDCVYGVGDGCGYDECGDVVYVDDLCFLVVEWRDEYWFVEGMEECCCLIFEVIVWVVVFYDEVGM